MTEQRLLKSEWRRSEVGRRARFYQLTAAGRRKLEADEEKWNAVEALVLSFVAALGGVAIAALALRQVAAATLSLASDLPFWISFRLSPVTIWYAVALSVLAAAIIGLLPALQANRRRLNGFRLRGAGGMRLAKTWTVLIVAQVACAVAPLPPAVSGAWRGLQDGIAGTAFEADRFLSAELGMVTGTSAAAPAFAARQTELLRRLEADPRVSGATFSLTIPGDEREAHIETDASSSPAEAKFNRVGIDFFTVFRVPVLAGRVFGPGDTTEDSAGAVERGAGALVSDRRYRSRFPHRRQPRHARHEPEAVSRRSPRPIESRDAGHSDTRRRSGRFLFSSCRYRPGSRSRAQPAPDPRSR